LGYLGEEKKKKNSRAGKKGNLFPKTNCGGRKLTSAHPPQRKVETHQLSSNPRRKKLTLLIFNKSLKTQRKQRESLRAVRLRDLECE